MGSRRLITVLLVCLVIYNYIPNTQANVGNHQEERHEYQYQRSSKVVGGTGYYNSRSGNVEQTAGNFDGWTQSQRDQVEGMAEKLRTELSTAQPYYGQECSKICALIPGFAGRSQEEIDQIAKDMTTQIIEDLQSGKLVRSQMNQPNWFEHQVAQKIIELRKHHQEQYQQNVYRATSRFHENQGSQVQPNMYAGGGTYNKETEDVQQQQENVFSEDDLKQIQQSVFDQRQQQQQGNFYQQQSQNQQHTVYTRPVNRYYNTQTTSRDSTNEQRFRTVYPTPMVVTSNVNKEIEDTEYTRAQTLPTMIPSYNRSFYEQKEYEEKHRNAYRPVVTPTQRTTTTTNVHVEQGEKEVRRQPQLPRVYNREENTEERETIYNRNRPIVVPPPRRTSYEVHNTEEEQKIVEVHTPSPVPTTSNRHSIYNHVEETELVPNYQPRVIIDKNTEFEILDHRRDYRPQVPTTHTQTTIHEREEEEHRRHHIPVTPATPQTTYREDRNDVELTQVVQQVTPRYQPSTSQHVITEETEESRTHLRPRPYYPVYPNHGHTIERNQTSTSTSFRRPTYPIYPSFRTNATTFENGDTYIRYESHIPTTYVIELTVEEYEERLHHLRNALSHLGYTRLTDEEYNATIAAGGFTHNGYKYIYNGDSGRFETTTKVTELTVEEYEDRLYRLRNELNRLGYTRMTEAEYNETIATGSFTHNGYRYVYNGNTGRFDKTIRVMDLTVEEYEDRLYRLRNELNRLGYTRMTEAEYNETIADGSFTHNGYRYVYNGNTGRFEKTTRVIDLTVEEYEDRLYRLRNELNRLGYTRMTESEYNETIATGSFTHNGYKYVYNGNTGRFEKTTRVIDLTVEEYEDRLYRLRNELNRLGYTRMTESEYNETIASGSFNYNGYRYVYNGNTGRFEKTTKVEVTGEEYDAIYETLQQKLREIGFGEMCQQEVQQAITTGVFIRDGNKFVYDSGREQYDKIRITNEERQEIFSRIQELLRRLGYRLLTQKENEGVLINGHFIRAAHQWIYNIVDGTIVKTIFVGDFAEFTDDEYREIYQKIQETLRRIGYAQMSDGQCNATITSGTFERGGIYWSYNPNNGEFERILLSQEEYRDRVQILRNELRRLGHRELSAEEFRKIIYQGYFHHGGYRYEYVRELRRYERIELTAEEYRERLRQLQEQLLKIGYGTMNEAQCNSTITSGIFYYGGYEWVYNFVTRDYQIGNRSDIDPTIPSNTGKDTSEFDKTKYNTTKPNEPTEPGNNHGRRPNHGIISRNRGDQPPQHFEEDYESDEIVEEEPGMGYYPTGKKPEVGLSTPEPFDRIRENTEIPTTSRPETTFFVPNEYQRDRYRHDQQLTTQIWPTQPATVSERRYHRKQTTYTQTSGVQPQTFATQRSMRHVPGNEFGEDNKEDNELEETSTPFEPLVVSTQAYLVYNNGNERPTPYRPDDESEIIEQYLKNERQHSPKYYGSDNNDYQQQTEPRPENIEDLGEHDFNGQAEEDVQQQLVDLDFEAEDLRQQQVDVNSDHDRNDQQRLLDGYTRESGRTEYNSHYHGQKETADEYDAQVVQVTDKADGNNEESPGLWTRFKDKTKDIFG